MSNKLIRYYIINIIYTTIFLIGSTTYWYFNIKGIQDNLDDYNIHVVNEIKLDNLKQVSDKETNSLASYEVSLKNNTFDKQKMMVYIMKSNLNSNLTNNYIKYQINNYGINSLNMDGMVYLDNINSLE